MLGKFRLFTGLLALFAVVTVMACTQKEPEEAAVAKEAIIFSDLNWTSAQLQNRVAQYIVEEGYGYPTAAQFGTTWCLMFQGLREGATTTSPWKSGCLTRTKPGWNAALVEG